MSQQVETQTEVLFTESPASWNTRYLTPEGFVCQLTLRDDNGVRLLEKSQSAMQQLLAIGCLPLSHNNNQNNHNRNGGNEKDPKAWCNIHNCEMKRYEKNGKAWYSHKANGEWCSGGKK